MTNLIDFAVQFPRIRRNILYELWGREFGHVALCLDRDFFDEKRLVLSQRFYDLAAAKHVKEHLEASIVSSWLTKNFGKMLQF